MFVLLLTCQKTLPRGLEQAGETPTDRSHNKDVGSCETVGVQGVPGSSVRLFLNFTVALCLFYTNDLPSGFIHSDLHRPAVVRSSMGQRRYAGGKELPADQPQPGR